MHLLSGKKLDFWFAFHFYLAIFLSYNFGYFTPLLIDLGSGFKTILYGFSPPQILFYALTILLFLRQKKEFTLYSNKVEYKTYLSKLKRLEIYKIHKIVLVSPSNHGQYLFLYADTAKKKKHKLSFELSKKSYEDIVVHMAIERELFESIEIIRK